MTDYAARQAELEASNTPQELERDRQELTAQIDKNFKQLDEVRTQHSKLTHLLDSNKLNNIELDDLAGYLSLLLESISRATYGHYHE